LECESPEWKASGKRQYHSISRGWIANEVFRRAHSKGSTIGEFLSEKVSGPLGARVYVGVPDHLLADYAPVKEISLSFLFGQSFIPEIFGRGVDYNIFQLLNLFNSFRKMMKEFNDRVPAYTGMPKEAFGDFFNQDLLRKGQSSSVTGNCSARGLAKVAAAMANGGTFKGVKVLGPKGWEALHAKATAGTLGFSEHVFHFTQGGVAEFHEDAGGRDGYYGWFGYGGSIFQWHPQLRIGFGYVPTVLEFHCMFNNKGRKLQGEVARCAQKLQTSQAS